MPDYWHAEIEKVNKEDEQLREKYNTLRNQFDIILQDASTHFVIDTESNFVSYAN